MKHPWITARFWFFNCTQAFKDPDDLKNAIVIRSRLAAEPFHRVRTPRVQVHNWWMAYMERLDMKLRRGVRGQAVMDSEIANALAAAGRCTGSHKFTTIKDLQILPIAMQNRLVVVSWARGSDFRYYSLYALAMTGL